MLCAEQGGTGLLPLLVLGKGWLVLPGLPPAQLCPRCSAWHWWELQHPMDLHQRAWHPSPGCLGILNPTAHITRPAGAGAGSQPAALC